MVNSFRDKWLRITATMCAFIFIFSTATVYAQYTSPSYQTNELFFGIGGELESTSPNYKAQSSAGALGVGNTSSPNYDAEAGFLTTNAPFLEMVVTGATVSFGTLSDSSTSSGAAQAGACSCSFTVRTYLSSEYTIKTMSPPPTNENGDVLDAKTTLGPPSSDPNIEEFGINLRDNASPDIGSNPLNDPDSSFADGEAATGYSTADQFKYIVGETIARAAATGTKPAIGKTNYTISYVAKRNSITQAGFYAMNHELVVVPVF